MIVVDVDDDDGIDLISHSYHTNYDAFRFNSIITMTLLEF